jgi:hypothetical protein
MCHVNNMIDHLNNKIFFGLEFKQMLVFGSLVLALTITSLDFNHLIDTKQSKSIGINHEWDC